MNCPVCDEPMIVLELDNVEIDHCISCCGIWLDAGELELLLESAEEKNDLLSSFEVDSKSKEKKRKCPICLKKMNKILCGADKRVLIDKCPRNDGIWFDKGELKEVIRIASLDRKNKIANLLNEMFIAEE